MMKWENEYLRIGGNRCNRNSHWIWFHWMIIEGYLVLSITKWPLSRITESTFLRMNEVPMNLLSKGRSIDSSFHSIPLLIVIVFLQLEDTLSNVSILSPSRAYSPSWMDWTFGKSESSIHSFNYSQTQLNEHTRMPHNQVWLIVVEEDLWIQWIQSIKLVNENSREWWKQQLPSWMNWREGRLFNSNDLHSENDRLSNTIDWSIGRSIDKNHTSNEYHSMKKKDLHRNNLFLFWWIEERKDSLIQIHGNTGIHNYQNKRI